MSAAPPEKAGSAASLSETSNILGSTLGLAVFGTIGTAIYRDRLVDSVPGDVPPAVVGAARETIGGATAAAERLPAGAAGELLAAAGEAFTGGLNAFAAVAAVVLVGGALGVKVVMNQRKAPAEQVTADVG